MMISPTQIRAARAVLNWTAKDLAARVKMSPATISMIENEQTSGSVTTLGAIYDAFIKASIDFLPNDGVARRQALVIDLKGQEGFRTLMDMVYETANEQGGEICLFNGSPSLFIKWLGQEWYTAHADRMRAIKDKFTFRVVVKDGDMRFIGGSFAEYRWIPSHLFRNKVMYIFGNRVAFIGFEDEEVRIQVMDQSELGDSMRVLFDIAWENVSQKIAEKS